MEEIEVRAKGLLASVGNGLGVPVLGMSSFVHAVRHGPCTWYLVRVLVQGKIQG